MCLTWVFVRLGLQLGQAIGTPPSPLRIVPKTLWLAGTRPDPFRITIESNSCMLIVIHAWLCRELLSSRW